MVLSDALVFFSWSGYPRWPGIVVKPMPKNEILQGHHLTGGVGRRLCHFDQTVYLQRYQFPAEHAELIGLRAREMVHGGCSCWRTVGPLMTQFAM